MVRNRRLRRASAAALIVAGALIMWLAPASPEGPALAGTVLLLAGAVLEILGIALEHGAKRRGRHKPLHRAHGAS